MFDEAYKSYVEKCKKFGIKPSSKQKMFGGEIERKQHANRVSISELSEARKTKAPALSETAKRVMENQTTRRVAVKKARREKKKPVKIEPVKPAKEILTEDEKRLKRNARAKAYYHKTKGDSQKREPLTDDEKIARGELARKKYYAKNREKILAHKKAKNAKKQKRVLLTAEQKKEKSIEKARLYHLKMKDDPEYQERRRATARKYRKNNPDKVSESNRKWRNCTRTQEQCENTRERDRARKQKERASA